MASVLYRQADRFDIPGMAQIRAANWGQEEYWRNRIARYMDCELHPQQALMPRVIYVAIEGNSLVGFVAGHLTRRYGCDGELEWINVVPASRGSGVASKLLALIAGWFAEQNASGICVNVDPGNQAARRFYTRHGAENLNEHWLVWNNISAVLSRR
ncbi:MAG TPA: GNAT family N-acetyltransferase [Bryobacteraceae bacterium]|jgi:GNAT superfamily N-acetyltransferase|nr:GNAT family N-acetyltransferase [Bryobacteraceae bacterium]